MHLDFEGDFADKIKQATWYTELRAWHLDSMCGFSSASHEWTLQTDYSPGPQGRSSPETDSQNDNLINEKQRDSAPNNPFAPFTLGSLIPCQEEIPLDHTKCQSVPVLLSLFVLH